MLPLSVVQPWMSFGTSSVPRLLLAWLLVTDTNVKPVGPQLPLALTWTAAVTFTSLWLLAEVLSLLGLRCSSPREPWCRS
jgi:hypothetical protein